MGDIPENEQAWGRKVLAENIRCKVCGEKIPWGEQTVYYERGLCGLCAHKEDKKD